jgi:hypothetical protein
MIYWLLFVVGLAMHMLKRMDYALHNKANPINSTKDFLKFYWRSIVIRTGLNLAFFGALKNPIGMAKLAPLSGMSIPVEIFYVGGAVVIFGYFADSAADWALGKIPGMKKEIPWLPGDLEEPKQP